MTVSSTRFFEAKFKSDQFTFLTVALRGRSKEKTEEGLGVPEAKEQKEDWVSSLREVEVIRDAMVHVTRNLIMGIIERSVYLELMTKYYEGIRRILLRALEANYPSEFFQSYTETFSEPAVTRLVTFLMTSYERAKLTPKEVRWCSLVLQGNIADAGPPPTPSTQEGPTPSTGTAASRTPVAPSSPAVTPAGRVGGTVTASSASAETVREEARAEQVIDEFTEFFDQLVAERDRLPERERPIIYIALLTIAYARGRIGRDVLVQMGNEYLERAKGSDLMWISERTRGLMRKLAAHLKRRGDIPSLMIQILERPEIVTSGRDLRIEE